MPAKSKRPLTDGEKSAIVTMRAQNITVLHIATTLNRSVSAVANFLALSKKAAKAAGFEAQDYKEVMRVKAVDAVNSGLDCADDPYKRGNLGARVLVGLGVFSADATVNVNQLINAVPPEWRERYQVTIDSPKELAETITVP